MSYTCVTCIWSQKITERTGKLAFCTYFGHRLAEISAAEAGCVRRKLFKHHFPYAPLNRTCPFFTFSYTEFCMADNFFRRLSKSFSGREMSGTSIVPVKPVLFGIIHFETFIKSQIMYEVDGILKWVKFSLQYVMVVGLGQDSIKTCWLERRLETKWF